MKGYCTRERDDCLLLSLYWGCTKKEKKVGKKERLVAESTISHRTPEEEREGEGHQKGGGTSKKFQPPRPERKKKDAKHKFAVFPIPISYRITSRRGGGKKKKKRRKDNGKKDHESAPQSLPNHDRPQGKRGRGGEHPEKILNASRSHFPLLWYIGEGGKGKGLRGGGGSKFLRPALHLPTERRGGGGERGEMGERNCASSF